MTNVFHVSNVLPTKNNKNIKTITKLGYIERYKHVITGPSLSHKIFTLRFFKRSKKAHKKKFQFLINNKLTANN